MTIRKRLIKHITTSIKTQEKMLKKNIDAMEKAAKAIVETFYKKGGTIYTCGNGGSAADAQHIAGELLCMLRTSHNFESRFPLPAKALTTDTSTITAIGNDFGFNHIFSRQLEAIAKPEDLLIALSTSGNSLNVLEALNLAKRREIQTIAFTGSDGGMIAKQKLASILIAVPSKDVVHIQEGHVSAFHAICDVIEEILFSEKGLS